MHRRAFLGALASTGVLSPLAAAGANARTTAYGVKLLEPASAEQAAAGSRRGPTTFQMACMTLPYAAFPIERALEGITAAGYPHVAWGVTHKDAGGQQRPALDVNAPTSAAEALAGRCRRWRHPRSGARARARPTVRRRVRSPR